MQFEYNDGYTDEGTKPNNLSSLNIFDCYDAPKVSGGNGQNGDANTSGSPRQVEQASNAEKEPVKIPPDLFFRFDEWERYHRELDEYVKESKRFEKEGAFLKEPDKDNLKSPTDIAKMIARNGLTKDALDAIRNSLSCSKWGENNPIAEINRQLAASGVQIRITEQHAPSGPPEMMRTQGGSCLVYAQLIDKAGNPVKDANGNNTPKMPLLSDRWITVDRFPRPWER